MIIFNKKHLNQYDMKKILLSLLAVVIATAAFNVQADNYGINVAGVEVSTSNYNNVTGGNINSGTVKYDPTNKILTLTNVSISRTGGDNYGVHNRYIQYQPSVRFHEYEATTKTAMAGILPTKSKLIFVSSSFSRLQR